MTAIQKLLMNPVQNHQLDHHERDQRVVADSFIQSMDSKTVELDADQQPVAGSDADTIDWLTRKVPHTCH